MYHLASVMPFMVCLVWTTIFLLEYRKSDPARRALTVFGIAATLLYFCHYLHFNGLQSVYSESLYYLCNLSVYPLYALYVKCLTEKRVPGALNLLWFLPAAIVLVISLTGLVRDCYVFQLTEQILFALISMSATIVAAINLFRFRARVDNYYSNPGEKRLNPIMSLIALLLATALASFTVNIIGRDNFMATDNLFIPAALFSVLLFTIFYVGYKTALPREEVRLETAPAPEDQDISATEALMEKIHQQMEVQQIFRSKGLTVADLAESVGSNRTYVSACINNEAGQSFSDYVNKWRIDYAMKLLKSDPTLTIAEVADKAGFTDRTTFYRSFKKISGMSPTEWLK